MLDRNALLTLMLRDYLEALRWGVDNAAVLNVYRQMATARPTPTPPRDSGV